MGGLDPDGFDSDQATRLIELHNALGIKFYRGVLDCRESSQYSESLLVLLEVCWRGPIVGVEDARGRFYGREDWQCNINGAHTAAQMNMETVPVFGHRDEVEEFDGHNIEDWTLYIIKLVALDEPDAFLNADTTPVFVRNYKRYLDLIDSAPRHRVIHFVRPSRTVDRCHIPTLDAPLRELPCFTAVPGAESRLVFASFRVGGSLTKSLEDTAVDAIMHIAGWKTESVAQRNIGPTTSTVAAGSKRQRGQAYADTNEARLSEEFTQAFAA
eukprot:g11318.t1